MASDQHPIIWLHHAGQHLGLLPSLGGGVAAWQLDMPTGAPQASQGRLDLWRPWAGDTDRYSLACFPMLPWSNRISAGGFDHDGVHHPLNPNRQAEPYPIHGDGWLQAWQLRQSAPDTLEMTLDSQAFAGDPYHYQAMQRFVLREGGMDQTLLVTHTGRHALPYGIGLHPWFLRTPETRLTTQAKGVWLSGADPLPTQHTTEFPPGWDPRSGMQVNGSLVDNAYTGWCGQASITWPEHQLEMTIDVPDIQKRGLSDGYFLLYRPPAGQAFCFEPVSHPIDAFHLAGQPGLRVLHTGESLSMQVEWRFKVRY